MGDTEKGNIDLIRRFQTPPFSPNYQLLPNNNNNNFTRVGGFPPSHPQMPPISPYSSQSPFNRSSGQGFVPGSCHSRSLSQPPIFNSDSLPPLAPLPYKDSVASPRSGPVSVEPPCVACVGSSPVMAIKEGLPPRKFHRRSLSDVPFGYGNGNGLFQSPPPLPPGVGGLRRTSSGGEGAGNEKPAQLIKKERGGEIMDDLLAAYMNLDSVDALNSWGANKKSDNEIQDEMDSEASNSKTKGCDNSDNDAENINSSIERKESLKRSAVTDRFSS